MSDFRLKIADWRMRGEGAADSSGLKPARRRRPAPRWQLQTAKAQFSEVVRRARAEGPQYVTRQGKDAVVVIPAEEFEHLTARAHQPQSLVRFFAESPLAGAGLNLRRQLDYGRDVEL